MEQDTSTQTSPLEAWNKAGLVERTGVGFVDIDGTADHILFSEFQETHELDGTYNFANAQRNHLTEKEATPDRRIQYALVAMKKYATTRLGNLTSDAVARLSDTEKEIYQAWERAEQLKAAATEHNHGINLRAMTFGLMDKESDSRRVITELAIQARIDFCKMIEQGSFRFVDEHELGIQDRRHFLQRTVLGIAGAALALGGVGCSGGAEGETPAAVSSRPVGDGSGVKKATDPIGDESTYAGTIEGTPVYLYDTALKQKVREFVFGEGLEKRLEDMEIQAKQADCNCVLTLEEINEIREGIRLELMAIRTNTHDSSAIPLITEEVGGKYSGIAVTKYSDETLHITIFDKTGKFRFSWDVTAEGIGEYPHATYPDGSHVNGWVWEWKDLTP